MTMNRKKRRTRFSREGQSMIEYILLMATVIAFLIVFFGPGGYFQQVYNRTIRRQGDDMLNTAISIFN